LITEGSHKWVIIIEGVSVAERILSLMVINKWDAYCKD
jgi:hypothetical protein